MMSASKTSSSKPPNVNISPLCHLDPVSYIKGDHLLTLESAVLVHPRSKLFTDAGSIIVREGSIISEKCTIGALSGSDPVVVDRGKQNSLSSISMLPAGYSNTLKSDLNLDRALKPPSELPIAIGKSVYVHPNVNIHPPCLIGDFVTIESGVTILPGCTVNAHSKICAGITLPTGTTVRDWTVVYGTDGRMKRNRHKDISEDARLEGMNRERVTAINLLRANASVNKLASSSSTGASRDKRQSILLSEGLKP